MALCHWCKQDEFSKTCGVGGKILCEPLIIDIGIVHSFDEDNALDLWPELPGGS